MADIWTFSGVNSPRDGRGNPIDYVGRDLAARLHDWNPRKLQRRYASRLGSSHHYPFERNVVRIDSEKVLDREAKAFAKGDINPKLGIKKGELIGRNLRVVLVAPKTTTKPSAAVRSSNVAYWGAYDAIPNQGIFRPDSLTYWRQWTDDVRPIRVKHGFNHYLRNDLHRTKRVRRRVRGAARGRQRYRYKWIDTTEHIPSVTSLVRDWLDSADKIDLIMVAHSQGTNIAMHVLKRGLSKRS